MKNHALAVIAAVLLAGCSSKSPEPADPVPDVAETPAESALPLPLIPETPDAEKESTSSSSAQSAASAAVYVSENEDFSGEYRPSIIFSDDGTFVMHENLYEGMGDYSGSYAFDGTYYECTVETIGFRGFAGDSVREINFMQYDANTVVLMDDLCGSRASDVFVKNSDGAELPSSAGTVRPPQEVGQVTETRTYISASNQFSDPYRPQLVLEPDGRFVLTENLYEGMGHYSGTWTKDDYILILQVEQTDFSGFAGDDVKEIRFEALSPDVLDLMTDLCGSVKFDTWYISAD